MYRIRARVIRVALAAAFAASMGSVTPAGAATPTAGGTHGAFVPDQLVYYHWGRGTYPAWLTTAVQDSLDTKFRNWNANNSHSPRPVLGEGSAVVYYTALMYSPCNPYLNPDWLACASSGGTTSFRIFIRDLASSGRSTWGWWDENQSCTRAGRTLGSCWYLERALIHEAGHAIPTFAHDDVKTEDDTVMRSIDPTVSQPGATHFVFQRCDQAALQMLWDVAKYTLPYADCFEELPGHGVRGLVTTVTASAGPYTSCASAYRLVRGRLSVANDARYGLLADNPVAARTVWFDRKRSIDTTWTLNAESIAAGEQVTGYNWSRAFFTPAQYGGAYDYRAHFEGDSGLDPSNRVTFTINWVYGC